MGYLFDPAVLHDIARKHQNRPHADMVRGIIDDLAAAYPGHVATTENWIFSIAGGAVGIMTILHGSLTEYVLIFGTPIGTEGFSGRYRMDIYDFMLAGEMWTYTEESFRERVLTLPGEHAVLRKGQAKGFKLPEGAWMLEYGRGFVAASLPFALSDGLLVCLDFRTVFKTIWLYGKQVVRELFKGKF